MARFDDVTADKTEKTDAAAVGAEGGLEVKAKRPTAKEARALRLAAELRANLKRRKASQRDRDAVESGGIGAPAPEGAAKMPPGERS